MLAANLFPNWIPRAPRRLGMLDFAILAVFGFGVISVVLAHEPWFDEAQGWLLAQDASIVELLVDFLRYEGHPPLWYLLLKTVGAAGLPYKAANVLSASLALLGVVLFLRLPGVPVVIRCLVPFGFFIAYQFTVVARAYAMLFPIMMGIAMLYPQRRRRPVLFALLLVLLSEVGLYGLAMAWAMAALYVLELLVQKVRLSAEERRSHLWAAVLLVGHTLFMVAVLWPPPDLLIAPNLTQDSALKRYLAVAGRFDTTCLLGSRNTLASSLAWLGLVLWFWRQRVLATYLVLNLSTTAVLGIYFNVWHEGFFFHTMLLCSLLALQHGAARGVRRLAGLALLVVIFATHVSWGMGSWRYDLDEAFSASAEVAEYLRFETAAVEKPTIAAIGFAAVGLQPYFDENIYSNYQIPGGHRFWDWSEDTPLYYRPVRLMDRKDMRVWLDTMLAESPDYIVASLKFPGDRLFEEWLDEHPGYHRVHRFDGALYWKNQPLEWESFVLYRRDGVASRRDGEALRGEAPRAAQM